MRSFCTSMENKMFCLAAGSSGLIITYCIGNLIYKVRRKKRVQRKCLSYRDCKQQKIEDELQKLGEGDASQKREEILQLSLESLINAAHSGKVSPVEILNAYKYKACRITEDLNCITELVEDAEQEAKCLSTNPPEELKLFGLPISIKESIDIKGTDSTQGLLKNTNLPSPDDAVIVQVLRHCGGIPFAKTNLAQIMFSFESSNPLFGRTSHPGNEGFTPGGSSSGEAALIAAGGSLLGFGSDTGGSIRCPAHVCGITGFMPTRGRISNRGLGGTPGGQIGPMAKDVDSVVAAMRALLCPLMFQLDVNVPPIPFNEQMFSSKTRLRIGYYYDDNYIKPVPAIQRSVEIAKCVLEERGHTLVPFNVPRVADVMRFYTTKVLAAYGPRCLKILEDEPIDPVLAGLVSKWSRWPVTRWITSMWLALKSPRIGRDISLYNSNPSAVQLQQLEVEIEEYREEFHKVWMRSNLDAVICPPFPVTAAPHGSFMKVPDLRSYTGLYNVLKYPAGVVPVTKVNGDDLKSLEDYVGHYDDQWDKDIKEMSHVSLGMPVGVQCVSLPLHDELCLRIMKEIESAVDYSI